MQFKFKAQKVSGEIYEGVREAPDKYFLYHELKREGDTLYDVREISTKNKWWNNIGEQLSSIRTHELIAFARNIGSMIEAGLSLSRALDVLIRQSKKKKLKEVLAGIRANVDKGETLSQSMQRYPKVFSPLFVYMTKAGEESGNLAESLKVVSNQLEKTYLFQKKLKGAMMYPAIIVCVMIVIGILMMIFIVPTLSATFKELGGELPLSTQFIIGVSNFLTGHFLTFLACLVLFISGVYSFLKSKVGHRSLDFFVLHMPIIAEITRETNAARTARTLSSLLTSGVDVIGATKITADVMQNSYYKTVVASLESHIQKGESMSSVFGKNEKLYPIFVSEMISVGEETGKLPHMLLEVAEYYEEDVERKTKDMSTVIEPFLMVFIGAVVGFFAIAMITPIYSLVDKI